MKLDKIVEAAIIARREFWHAQKDVSESTKQATHVTKAWQKRVASKEVECEVPIKENLNEKIDVIDFSSATAYEMKVSGKNAGHEFYKDIFKVLIYNQNHDKKLKRLVFITEKEAIEKLNKGLGDAVRKSVALYKLAITLKPCN